MAGEWRGDEWGWLNPYLFSSMFLALRGGGGSPSELWSLPRVRSSALAKGKMASAVSVKHPMHIPRNPPRDSGSRAGKGKAPHSTVCLQWNQGECVYPYCKFRHVYVRCGGDHRTGSEMLDGRGRYIYMYMYMEHLLLYNRRVPLETSALPDGISMICRVLIAWFR